MILTSDLMAAEAALIYASAHPSRNDGFPATAATEAISARHLAKSYGGLQAVADMSLALKPGAIVGLIGPNGAGKTTMLNLLSGVERADSGRIVLAGKDVTGLPQHKLAAAGLTRTFQVCRDLGALTVLENLLAARVGQAGELVANVLFRPGLVRAQEEAAMERARDILERLDLWRLANASASTLSGGQKKLLEFGRALMADPKIILLDEPAAGVAPSMESILIEAIQSLVSNGTAVLIVEHDLDVVATLCEHVYVMAAGRLLTEGTFSEITRSPEVVDAYLGRAA